VVSFEELKDGLPSVFQKGIALFDRLWSGDDTRDFATKDLTVSGEVTYKDTFFDDLRIPLTQSKQGSNLKPDFDQANVGLLFPQSNADEIAYFIAQMPHGWKEGTAIFPHIHWQQSAATGVVWKLAYKLIPAGGEVPAAFTTIASTDNEFAYISGNLGQISRLGSTAGIDMSGYALSTLILAKLYRDDNTTTGDVTAWDIDFHYEIDTPGSRQEFIK